MEALLNHTKDICKVIPLESVQETLHITTSRKHKHESGFRTQNKAKEPNGIDEIFKQEESIIEK